MTRAPRRTGRQVATPPASLESSPEASLPSETLGLVGLDEGRLADDKQPAADDIGAASEATAAALEDPSEDGVMPGPAEGTAPSDVPEPETDPGPVAPAPPQSGDAAPAPAPAVRGKGRSSRGASSRAASAPPLEPTPEPEPDPFADGRPAPLRMAALHLRTGQHALARAELEALAGRGRLDEAALLDLAEVRWRTGDLAGAGDAAGALLTRGAESPLALVIAAESVAAQGRPGEARRLSARAVEVLDVPLDGLFLGMPRALIWPEGPAGEQRAASTPRRARGRRAVGEGDGAPSTAAEAFAGGRAALARGDATRAALLLGVAMRLEPGFAEDVLRAVAGRDDQPLLALVRGDALRLLGREAEALEAFDHARGRSGAPADSGTGPEGPGLFDLDLTADEAERP